MRIGEIAGEVAALVVPSRRHAGRALVRRRDGWVFMIDAAAPPDQRVIPAWVSGKARDSAADCHWLSTSCPVVLTADGELHSLKVREGGSQGLKTLHRVTLYDEVGEVGRRESLAMLTGMGRLFSGSSVVTVSGDQRVVWLETDSDFSMAVTHCREWSKDCTSSFLAKGGGPILPWFDHWSFVRLRDTGGFLSTILVQAAGDLLNARAIHDLARPHEPMHGRYPMVAGCLPVRSGEDSPLTDIDVVVVYPSVVKVIRVSADGSVRQHPVNVYSPAQDGYVIRSIDLRGGRACVATESPDGTSGAVDVVNWANRQLVWRFELDSSPQDCCLLWDAGQRRMKAVAVCDDGSVYMWPVEWNGSAPVGLTPQTRPAVDIVGVRTLDMD